MTASGEEARLRKDLHDAVDALKSARQWLDGAEEALDAFLDEKRGGFKDEVATCRAKAEHNKTPSACLWCGYDPMRREP